MFHLFLDSTQWGLSNISFLNFWDLGRQEGRTLFRVLTRHDLISVVKSDIYEAQLMFAQPLEGTWCSIIAECNIIVNYLASGNIKIAVCSHSSSAGGTRNHKFKKTLYGIGQLTRKKKRCGGEILGFWNMTLLKQCFMVKCSSVNFILPCKWALVGIS